MTEQSYHVHISSRHRLLDLKLRELWQYRDLIVLFAKKSITVSYKQTILGPAWLLISPLLSSLIYLLLFGKIAGLGTDGVPQMLFYLCGTAIWGFFSTCLTGNAGTFVNNVHLFGKVYFPRLTIPVANILSALVKFAVQMLPVLALLGYYCVTGVVRPHWTMWCVLPLLLIQLSALGMGVGILISSLTTKYRDLTVLVSYIVQLWMYATPVVYPLSHLPEGALKTAILWNPASMPIELFRYAVLGVGTVVPACYAASWLVTVAVLLLGMVIFHKVERTFMDTV